MIQTSKNVNTFSLTQLRVADTIENQLFLGVPKQANDICIFKRSINLQQDVDM